MALINEVVLENIADRLAWQTKQIVDGVDTMLDDNGGAGTKFSSLITETNDVDVEIPLLNTYWLADGSTSISGVLRSMSGITSIINGMDTHFARVGHTGSWDAYLEAKMILASSYFNKAFFAAKNQNMLANHVFYDGMISFGTVEVLSGPDINFTDGYDFGNGASTNRATEGEGSSKFYAPTQLQVYIPSGGSIASSTVIVIEGKDETDNTKTIQVSPTASSTEGHMEDIGTASDLWLDVTDVTLDGTNLAESGLFWITNKQFRVPTP